MARPLYHIVVDSAVIWGAPGGDDQLAGLAVDVEGAGLPRFDLLIPGAQLDVIAGHGQVLDGISACRKAGQLDRNGSGLQRHRLVISLPVRGLGHSALVPGPFAADAEAGCSGDRHLRRLSTYEDGLFLGPGEDDLPVVVQIPHLGALLIQIARLHAGSAHIILLAAHLQRDIIGDLGHRDVDGAVGTKLFRQLPAYDTVLCFFCHPIL